MCVYICIYMCLYMYICVFSYNTVGNYIPFSAFEPSPPFVDSFMCTGNETALVQCLHSFPATSCGRQAGVECAGKP